MSERKDDWIKKGVTVIDGQGMVGVVKEFQDIHNVWVKYENGSSGVYCLDKNCKDYDPLFPAPPKKEQ